jgi:hypothetical protein
MTGGGGAQGSPGSRDLAEVGKSKNFYRRLTQINADQSEKVMLRGERQIEKGKGRKANGERQMGKGKWIDGQDFRRCVYQR